MTTGAPIRVLIAEDEPLLRESLADLVRSEAGLELVGAASDAEEVVEMARAGRANVAIIDVKMPKGGGPAAARGIRAASPATRILAFSAHDDRSTILTMVRAGASGYVIKGAADVLEVVRRVARGEVVLSTEVTAEVVRELAQQLERAEAQAAEMKRIERTKTELVQLVAHEILTPVTVVRGAAQTLLANGLTGDDLAQIADGVARASERIRRLVDQLSMAALLDFGAAKADPAPCSAEDLVQEAVAALGSASDRVQLLPHAKLGVWADPNLTVQALTSVLENAVAFSPQDAPVEVEALRVGGMVEVQVSDRGPGFPEGSRDRMFESLTQGDDTTTRAHQGLGLGLYLARRIMEANEGRIRAEDRPGGGTRLVLSFSPVEPELDPQGPMSREPDSS